jgi:hypothetical protein
MKMKTIRDVCILVLFSCLTTGATAYAIVGNVGIAPASDLVSGQTHVSVSFVIDFPASGGETFSSDNSLQMSTDLADARWSPVLVLDGVETQMPDEVGSIVHINGWELSYPAKRALSMRVTMEGTAPIVSTSQSKTILRVATVSGKGAVVPGSEVIRQGYVINPSSMQSSVSGAQRDLSAFRALLDAKSAQGVDISAAEAKYREADTALQSAAKSSSYIVLQGYVDNAEAAISDGKKLLDKAFADKTIQDAQKQISQTDGLIRYFTVDRSMGADARLASVISEREQAADLLSDANDLSNQGKYEEAQMKAAEALEKGIQALNHAQILKNTIGDKPSTVQPTYQPQQSNTQQATSVPTTQITPLRTPVTIDTPSSDSQQGTPIITNTPSIDAQQQEIIDKLNRQNQLLEEQNRKLNEQNNLLQNLIDVWNNILRALGISK